jgi:predicted CoA-binding protein
MKNKTVIVGASPNEGRYAFLAARMLKENDHDLVPLGIREGSVGGKAIQDIREQPKIDGVDTVTMYISPRHQPAYYDYIVGLKPRRFIFNPGSENPEFIALAERNGIKTLEACTLVLLRSHQY